MKFRRQQRPLLHSPIVGCVIAAAVLCLSSYGVCWWRVDASRKRTLSQAEHLLEKGATEESRDTLSWLLWFYPNDPDGLFLQGASLYMDENYEAAVSNLTRVTPDSAAYGAASLTQARALLKLHRMESAETILSAHLRRIPQSDPARQALIELYMQQLRKRKAVALLEDRSRRFPDDLTVFRGLLLIDSQHVTPNSTLPDLEQANSKHPDQPSVTLAIARANHLLGRTHVAMNFFEKTLQLRPTDAEVTTAAALFFLETGDTSRAADLLRRIDSSVSEPDDRVSIARSRLYEHEGKYEHALDEVNKAIAIRPDEIEYYSTRAGVLRKLGRTKEAGDTSTQAAAMVSARQELFLLVDTGNIDHPTRSMCNQLVSLYETLRLPDRANAWRRLSQYAKDAPQ